VWLSLKRCDEISELIKDAKSYGISYEKDKSTKEFSYLVAHEIDPYKDIPEGMITLHIPKITYIIVKCTLPSLSDAWTYTSTWISKNGYKDISKNFPEFEVYPEDHENEQTDTMYIYVPIIKNN